MFDFTALCEVFFQKYWSSEEISNQSQFRQQKRLLNELNRILRKEHVRGVLSAHEQLMEELTQGAARNPYFEMYEYEANLDSKPANEAREHELNEARGMPVRVVGIRKAEDEPLGITVRQEDDGRVVVARVMTGGVVDVQGLLHVNDQILEMNGQPVQSAAQLQQMMRRCNDSLIQFRIVPSFDEPIAQLSCHVKSLFNYDPSVDTLLPCKELGLPFVQGDILEIMNQEDANWWQARKVDTLALSEAGAGNTLTMGARVMFTGQQIGLIPSQELEEKRWAFVRPEFDYASKTSICGTQVIKKKKKSFYSINANTAFDNAELIFYEEVCRLNHFQRKCIVLVGASGVGRKAMKQR